MSGRRLARRIVLVLPLLALIGVAAPLLAQAPRTQEEVQRAFQTLAWQRGPTEGKIGTIATIKVPEGEAFLDAANTRRFLELNGNPPRDNHYALVADNWFAIFSFRDSGYVKDDEKLDGEALLKSLKEGDGPANEERRKLGMAPLHTEGWHVAPHYDTASKRLEWGLRLRGDGGPAVVNYTIRILGRRGVMSAILVSDPQSLNKDISVFKAALGGYEFVPGERYAEFRAGDRVAEYGLAALVLGGAAVVATKTGFFKAFWKLLVVGGIALAGTATAVLRRLFGRR